MTKLRISFSFYTLSLYKVVTTILYELLSYVLHLLHFRVCMLQLHFMKASKDGLRPLEKLETTRKKIKCLGDLHVIDGGDHSFKIGRKHPQTTGLSQDEAENLALQAIAAFWLRSLEGR